MLKLLGTVRHGVWVLGCLEGLFESLSQPPTRGCSNAGVLQNLLENFAAYAIGTYRCW